MARAPQVRLKRVYDEPARADGQRVLVDRVWPRGLSKEDARLDEWLKDVALDTPAPDGPTTERLEGHRYLVQGNQDGAAVEIEVRVDPGFVSAAALPDVPEERVVQATVAYLLTHQRLDELPPQLDLEDVAAAYPDFEDDLRRRLDGAAAGGAGGPDRDDQPAAGRDPAGRGPGPDALPAQGRLRPHHARLDGRRHADQHRDGADLVGDRAALADAVVVGAGRRPPDLAAGLPAQPGAGRRPTESGALHDSQLLQAAPVARSVGLAVALGAPGALVLPSIVGQEWLRGVLMAGSLLVALLLLPGLGRRATTVPAALPVLVALTGWGPAATRSGGAS